MRRIVMALLIMCGSFKLFAQGQHHFIYFENSKKEWFTISVNNVRYESIGKDYVIVPKLNNGTYSFVINTQTAKETVISITIQDEDKGFSIKQNSDREIELFDLNSFNTIKANDNIVTEAKTETPILPKEQAKEPEKQIGEPVKTTPKNNIKKVFTKTTIDGVNEIYIDNEDTVSIFIPVTKQEAFTAPVEAKPEPVKVSTMPSGNADLVIKPNTSCKNIADETDVKNLTIALQAQLKVRDRLKVAETYIKEKCYTTNQIKRLCSMFINSQGKLIFFRQSQKHIADVENFPLLETELTDAATIEEFKAFVKQL